MLLCMSISLNSFSCPFQLPSPPHENNSTLVRSFNENRSLSDISDEVKSLFSFENKETQKVLQSIGNNVTSLHKSFTAWGSKSFDEWFRKMRSNLDQLETAIPRFLQVIRNLQLSSNIKNLITNMLNPASNQENDYVGKL